MKFQLSIRGAFYLTTVIAVYSAILALAYRGNLWGKGISFAVTCSIVIWIASAFLYWVFFLILKALGLEERNRGTMNSPIPMANPVKSSPQVSEFIGTQPQPSAISERPSDLEEAE